MLIRPCTIDILGLCYNISIDFDANIGLVRVLKDLCYYIYISYKNKPELIILHLLAPHHHSLLILPYVIKCPLTNCFSSTYT